MTSHFGLLVLFAAFVSLIFATIAKETPTDQVKMGLSLFGSFVGAALVLGWLMRALPL
ncbi:MAG: hypothetical protein WC815_11735 [Vicinamibacterales bacterium]|jgi:hypothetical protein